MRVWSNSLKVRLTILILVPLLYVSIAAVYGRFETARNTAEEIFDRNLFMLSLAVSRDVAISDGDTLSETSNQLFREATGGQIFYHVYGPDGSFVTGYSSPPIGAPLPNERNKSPLLFNGSHQGHPVRVVRLEEPSLIDGFSGISVVTVWQRLQPRQKFAQQQAIRAAILASLLVLTTMVVVIFGIRLGLKPLEELEDAIQKRSASDLSPISRRIPIEAKGILQRLNDLFAQLTQARASQDRLISNAAHQLRNPIAAVHAMAQATLKAKTLSDSQDRASELVTETRHAMRLTNQMLSLERMKGITLSLHNQKINSFVQSLAERLGPKILQKGIDFNLSIPSTPLMISFDPTLLGEAINNLIDNAIQHAGTELSEINLTVIDGKDRVWISVENDGLPIESDTSDIFDRFTQGTESRGAGLGLAIVQEVANQHHALLKVENKPRTKISMGLPIPR